MTLAKTRRRTEGGDPAAAPPPIPGEACGWSDEGSFVNASHFHRVTTAAVLAAVAAVRYDRATPRDIAALALQRKVGPAFGYDLAQWATIEDRRSWPFAWSSTSAAETVKRAALAELDREHAANAPPKYDGPALDLDAISSGALALLKPRGIPPAHGVGIAAVRFATERILAGATLEDALRATEAVLPEPERPAT